MPEGTYNLEMGLVLFQISLYFSWVLTKSSFILINVYLCTKQTLNLSACISKISGQFIFHVSWKLLTFYIKRVYKSKFIYCLFVAFVVDFWLQQELKEWRRTSMRVCICVCDILPKRILKELEWWKFLERTLEKFREEGYLVV